MNGIDLWVTPIPELEQFSQDEDEEIEEVYEDVNMEIDDDYKEEEVKVNQHEIIQ